MASQTVGAYILERLHENGVRRIYGYPGDGINGILGGFHEFEGIEFVQTRHEELVAFAATAHRGASQESGGTGFGQPRHEELVAFAATAHAKLTGDVGVCLATSGPGAIHLLNGLYDAKLDHQPVVAIVGQQATASMGANYQQEVDLVSLFKDVASEFVQVCMSPSQARHLIDRAVKSPAASRSVPCVITPNDVQEAEHEAPPRAHGSVFSSPGFAPPRVLPRD